MTKLVLFKVIEYAITILNYAKVIFFMEKKGQILRGYS